MSSKRELDAPVLIAGGGLVGLSAAMFLAQHGIASIAIERLKQSSPLPRAAFFHMRTLEMFRSAGIEQRVRDGSFKDFTPEGAIISVDTLATGVQAKIIGNLNEGVEALSPCRRLFLNQPNLEPILRDRARESGASVLTGYEVAHVEQDNDGVTVTAKDTETGAERTLRGRYLIAADGAHSKAREIFDIPFEGRGVFSNSITIYFTADLSPYIGDNAWSIIYVNNKTLNGFFRMDKPSRHGFLVVNSVGDPSVDPVAAANVAADISEGRLKELIRASVGVPDLDVRIDGVSRWRATADVARNYRVGRVFIAGDAAHLMPPNGGFGGNTGIHDAHNLAWKLALVLQGRAGDALLDTYEIERKPVAKFTVEQAFARYVGRTAPWLQSSQRTDKVVNDFNIEIGYLYDSASVLSEAGSPKGSTDPHETRGMPGARLPHVLIDRKGAPVSTLDLVKEFVLFAGPEGADWTTAAQQAARTLGVTIDTYRAQHDFQSKDFLTAFGLGNSGATLIRPDGFVAWRSPSPSSSTKKTLMSVMRQILALP